jgi:hypothetical protein
MNKYSPYIGVALLVLITCTAGWLQGNMTNRFGMPEDMNEGAQKLANLKKLLESKEPFGERKEWTWVSSTDMTNTVVETLECQGYINASFKNSEVPGLQINGFIIIGPPGPVAVHTPEICYSSQDYDITDERERVRIFPKSLQEDEFWGLTLRSKEVNADILRVYYSWTNLGPWTAPDIPRITYGGGSKLYKMQLAVKLPADSKLEQGDACQDFLRAFLPVVNAQLFDSQPAAEAPVAEVSDKKTP